MKHPIDLRLAPEDVYCPCCERNAWNEFVEAFYIATASTNYKIVPAEIGLTCVQCYKNFVIKLSMEIEL